jgi:molecular chaperone HscB
MQPADLSTNFFALFGLPVSFHVDIDALVTRYREMQRSVHPDRFASAAEAERRMSVQMAARLNEGLHTLKDPLARGRYLLQLRGVDLNDSDTRLDHEFLMEQMELREHLDGIRERANPEASLASLSRDIQARIAELTAEMGAALDSADANSQQVARDRMRKLQFFRRLEEEAAQLDEELSGY